MTMRKIKFQCAKSSSNAQNQVPMREIKFRGLSESGKWLYGCLSEIGRYTTIMSKGIGEIVDAKTVGQYTGLKDSKGHEIYEGDIVENVNGFREAFGLVAKVKFNNRHCAFMLYYPGGDCIQMDAERQYEIVGNSYENPNS